MDICTIIAKNYVSHARVLARSHARHDPGSRCFCLVIDEVEGYIDAAEEPFELVRPEEIGIDRYDRMAALYSVLELSTAVKPWLLRHLLDGLGIEQVAYLDPDIRIFRSLSGIDELLRENQLVVTPHATSPMPRDGRRPSEAEILTAGVYNLGFIGMSRGEDTDLVLDWWAERLERDCVVDPERGFFVDQRWIDFAPGLVESFHILRDPGYNVAYWNLPSRDLQGSGERYTVDGSPLTFFHFSGFRPHDIDTLSAHQDRVAVRDGTALRRICELYAEELMAAGYDDTAGWPYGYRELPNGLELDARVRAVYREATANGQLDGSVWEPDGAEALVRYLNAPADEGGHSGVTRYLHAAWELDDELRAGLPDLRGVDAARLVAWANSGAGGDIPDRLLPAGAAADGEGRSAPRAGVNLAGYFRAVLGVGEVARNVVDALEDANVAVAPVGLVAGESDEEESSVAPRGGGHATFPINLVCVNADAIGLFAAQMGPEFFAGRHTIGFWWWEVEQFPERWLASFEHVDELWAGSRHVADALSQVSPVPVVKVTTPVDPAPFEPLGRAELGLPQEGFLFLFSFDHKSVFERKNPLGAIEAFTRAFEPGEGPQLVMKSIGGDRHPAEHRRLEEAAAGRPDVHVIDRALPRARKDALIAACDAYVSLHRAEGFGIGLAEAMWLGKPAIATNYSGNLDFMSASTGWLVDCEQVAIGAGAEPYPPEGTWAEPDLDHAARLMREVAAGGSDVERRALRGQAHVRRNHSRAAAGEAMAKRLVRIQDGWGLRGGAIARDGRGSVESARAAKRISAGPLPAGRRQLKGPRRVLREALLRTMKPYTAYQRNLDQELLHAIQALDNGVRELTAGQAQLRAQVARLVADARALPEPAEGVALAEHPGAGVVSGYGAVASVVGEPALSVDADQLGPESLRSRLGEALRAGGLVCLRATNPHSPRAMKTFWADPSKARPLFPETALQLCRDAGFAAAFFHFPGGTHNVEADRFHEDAYELIAAPPDSFPRP